MTELKDLILRDLKNKKKKKKKNRVKIISIYTSAQKF